MSHRLVPPAGIEPAPMDLESLCYRYTIGVVEWVCLLMDNPRR